MRQQMFTAERQLSFRQPPGPQDEAPAVSTPTLEAIDRRLTAIEQHLAALALAGEPASAPEPEPVDEELAALLEDRRRVTHTLAEIGVLRQSGTDGSDRLTAAGRELDAVVDATEGATNAILHASEVIERVIDDLHALAASNPLLNELLSEAQEALSGIYEAASFQDITGQRITKVVSALRFVDEHIARLEAIWSATGEVVAPPPVEALAADDESHLLNGPQLAGEALDQDAIDALFND